MKYLNQLFFIFIVSAALLACDSQSNVNNAHDAEMHEGEEEVIKGPHGGRLLSDDDFALELTIFETGIPPEFRVFASHHGELINPELVDLQITLTRLGGDVDEIHFRPQGEVLRGDMEIVEPHSFVVSVVAKYNGKTHRWEYENFEGRTKISSEIAASFDLETTIAGPAKLEESITVYGQIVANPENVRKVSARFEGAIQRVHVSIGDVVTKGQALARIESNESLSTYAVKAPISGVITERNANAGEQSNGRQLFTIMDTSSVWANLMVFPKDRARIKKGAPVMITTATDGKVVSGEVSYINIVSDVNQAVVARVILDNSERQLVPGTYVTGRIVVANYEVPLAVLRSGLQSFRDFTVVYAQIGEEYEVRMLELGRQDEQWVEVLGGLSAGTRYVSKNSYLVKADIEKSGASHDH